MSVHAVANQSELRRCLVQNWNKIHLAVNESMYYIAYIVVILPFIFKLDKTICVLYMGAGRTGQGGALAPPGTSK